MEKNKIKIEIDADFECKLIDMNVFEDGEEITDFSLGNLVSLYTVVLAVKKEIEDAAEFDYGVRIDGKVDKNIL